MQESSISCVLVVFSIWNTIFVTKRSEFKNLFYICARRFFKITKLRIPLSQKWFNHCSLRGGREEARAKRRKSPFLGVLVCVCLGGGGVRNPAVIIHPPQNLIVCLHNTAYRVISFYVRTMGFWAASPPPLPLPQQSRSKIKRDGWKRSWGLFQCRHLYMCLYIIWQYISAEPLTRKDRKENAEQVALPPCLFLFLSTVTWQNLGFLDEHYCKYEYMVGRRSQQGSDPHIQPKNLLICCLYMHVVMSVSAHSMCTNISLSGRWGGLNGSCVILEPSEPARSPCSAYHLATTFRPAQGQPHP